MLGNCATEPEFYQKLGFSLRMLRDQLLSASVNLFAQTFAAVVDRMRFAIDKALCLCATLIAGLILDDVDCFGYF